MMTVEIVSAIRALLLLPCNNIRINIIAMKSFRWTHITSLIIYYGTLFS